MLKSLRWFAFATFAFIGTSLLASNTVAAQADGSTQVRAGFSCQSILTLVPASASGVYWIDPLTPGNTADAFQAECDMVTDGGGWTLVLNYNHLGGTNPALIELSTRTPRIASSTLGTDESGNANAWGHATPALLATMRPTELLFRGATSGHARVIHFKTRHSGTIAYFTSGSGDVTGLQTSFTTLTGHTANLPGAIANVFSNQGNSAMTNFPYWLSGTYHWGIRGLGNRWEVDDYPNNESRSTLHRIWIRSGTLPCVNSIADSNDGTCDAANCTLREAATAANAFPGVDTICFSIPGAGPHRITLGSHLPIFTGPVIIDGSGEAISGDPGVEVYYPSNASSDQGIITLNGSDSTVRLLSIGGHLGNTIGQGVRINTTGATVSNVLLDHVWLGVAANGTVLANARGVQVGGSGGTGPTCSTTIRDSVISGNSQYGVLAQTQGCSGLTMTGNRIGTNPLGTAAISNANFAIWIGSSQDVTIGGSSASARNVISGNSNVAIFVQSTTRLAITGNYFGTTLDGLSALPNGDDAIRLSGASVVTIGGNTAASGNVIAASGNSGSYGGVRITGTSGTIVLNNYFGTDRSGNVALRNLGLADLFVDNNSPNTRIGAPGQGNIFAGSRNATRGEGIYLHPGCTGSVIQANSIGVGASGAAMGAREYGILAWNGTTDTLTIGGVAAGEANVIANHGTAGVFLGASFRPVAIRANVIYASPQAIDLSVSYPGDGVTVNDNGDSDSGSNDLLNYPVLTAAWTDSGSLVLSGYSRAGAQLDCYAAAGDRLAEYYIGSFTEGSVSDQDLGTGGYNYAGIGIEASTSLFTFTPTIASLSNLPGGAIPANYKIACTANIDSGGGRFITSEFGNGYRVVPAPMGPVIASPLNNAFTNDTTPTVSGTIAASNATSVRVYQGSTLLCTAPVTMGSWSCDTTALVGSPATAHTLTTVADLSPVGTIAGASNVTITVDTVVPGAPTSPAIAVTSGNAGTSMANPANDNTPTLSGTGEAFATLTVRNGTDVICTLVVDASGNWSCTPSALADGNYDFTASQTDRAGNASATSTAAATWYLDATRPAVIDMLRVSPASPTNDSTPTFTGLGENGATVSVRDGSNNVICTAMVASASWTCTATTTLLDGNYLFTATQTDGAGNQSDPTSAVALDIDTTAETGTIDDPANGNNLGPVSTVSGTGIGTSAIGATVNVEADGNAVTCSNAPVVIDGSGHYSCTLPTDISTAGSHTVHVTLTDAAGNVTSPPIASTFNVDPSRPGVASISNPTSPTTLANGLLSMFVGQCTAGNFVTITQGSTTLCTDVVCATDGTYTCTPGAPITLSAGTNAFGTSARNPNNGFAPATDSVSIVYVDMLVRLTLTTPVSGTPITTSMPTFSGSGGYSGATVTILDGTTTVCTALVSSDGTWSCVATSALSEGQHSFSIRQSLSAPTLLESPASVLLATVNASAPSAPTVTAPTSGSTAGTTTTTFSGTGEVGSTVHVRGPDALDVCTVMVATDGTWTCTPTAALSEGSNQTYSVVQIDGLGQMSAATSITGLTVETPLVAPSITAPTNGSASSPRPVFSGTGINGTTIEVLDGSTVICTATVSNGMWTCTPSADLMNGGHIITAVQIRNGNRSTPSAPVNITSSGAAVTDAGVDASNSDGGDGGRDAGRDGGSADSGASADSGRSDGGGDGGGGGFAGSGCGCRVGADRNGGFAAFAALLLLSCAWLSRRRSTKK